MQMRTQVRNFMSGMICTYFITKKYIFAKLLFTLLVVSISSPSSSLLLGGSLLCLLVLLII